MPFDKALTLRIISAAILMPVVLGVVMYGGLPFYILIGIAVALSLYEWLGMTKGHGISVPMVIGIGYVLFCFAAFLYIRLYLNPYGLYLTLYLLFMVWATDIGAYFSGKIIGGKKLAPTISPNKTWAGLFGGITASIVTFFIFDWIVGLNFTGLQILIFGAVIALAGQIGDLGISYFKRKAGLKDTGTLIPGHGGLLDRIDSLLLASPVFLLLLKAFGL